MLVQRGGPLVHRNDHRRGRSSRLPRRRAREEKERERNRERLIGGACAGGVGANPTARSIIVIG